MHYHASSCLSLKTIKLPLSIQQTACLNSAVIQRWSHSGTRQQACIVGWMWKWESFGKQFTKPALLREGDRTNSDDTQSWLHTAMTSLPLRVWQLSTSSLWQPDECSEWAVTLATAMLSWPSPYILPDSPRWRWVVHTHNNAHTHTHTHRHTTHTHKHFVNMYTCFIFFCVFLISEALTQTVSANTHLNNAHAHTPMLLWE